MGLVKSIRSRGIRSISQGVAWVTLHSTVNSGPANTVNRDSEVTLDDGDLTFLLSTLATMAPYRKVWRGVADELDRCEAIATAPDASPIERVTYAFDSVMVSNCLHNVISDTVGK